MADVPEDRSPGAKPSEKRSLFGPQGKRSPTWVGMSGVGFEFVAAILLPGAIGWWLDRWLGSGPWIMLVAGLLGFVAGLRLLMRSVGK